MLKLEALVKQLVIEELVKELIEIGVHSLSYSEVFAANRPLFHETQGENVPQNVEFLPVLKLEVILDKNHLPAVEEALADKVSAPLAGGAEVTVMKLKEGLRVLGSKNGDPQIEEI